METNSKPLKKHTDYANEIVNEWTSVIPNPIATAHLNRLKAIVASAVCYFEEQGFGKITDENLRLKAQIKHLHDEKNEKEEEEEAR